MTSPDKIAKIEVNCVFLRPCHCIADFLLQTFRVPPRWLFVRVETEQGIVGWGESSLEGTLPIDFV